MSGLDISHGLNRLIIAEDGDIMSFVAGFFYIKLSEAGLADLIDGAADPLITGELDGGDAAPPLAGPAGKDELVVRQGSHKLGLLCRLSALLHLALAEIRGIGKVVHNSPTTATVLVTAMFMNSVVSLTGRL